MSKKITAIYLRVSTANGQRFESQKDELDRWVEVHQPENVRFYRDTFTGKTMDRPGMQKLIEELHRGRIGTIICWRLDRLGRTASGLTKLFEDLRQYRCNLISLKDNLDLSSASGRLNANIIASVASYETEIRAERVKAGQMAAKARGKKWGGSRKGKRKGKTEEKVKSVLALLEQGISKAAVARSVGVSLPTVYSIMRETRQ